MKFFNLLLLPLFTALLLCFSPTEAKAQPGYSPWDLLADLLNQTDTQTNENFLDNFGNIDPATIDFGENNETLQQLFDELNGPFPGGMLDSTYLDVWGPGFGLILDGLPGYGLSGSDEDTLLNQYGNLEDIFASNFDSLGGAFGQYQDSLLAGTNDWDIVVIGLDDLTNESAGALQDTFDMVFGNTTPNGPGDIDGIIGQLFDVVAFPDLELAFGMQEASLKYWDNPYDERARVLRVGSVPRFDQDVDNCNYATIAVPIEARWHVQASWTGEAPPASPATDPGQAAAHHGGDFNPLLFSGDFAMMATPTIGTLGNTRFKLITSLGMEFGTYAPAHRDYNAPFTSGNQGFATGFGPQAGSGFAFSTGPLTVYSIGTIVIGGEMLRCGPAYRYNSTRFESGIRYGNIINVRYSTGKFSWQPNDNRTAKVGHQVTVGIILSELHP